MTDITPVYSQFKELLASSKRILITAHISPDPDAVASVLLMGTTLSWNFPDKEILMVLEEEPIGLNFLEGYDKVVIKNLLQSLNDFQPDLLILLDGNNYSRASRLEGDKIRDYVTDKHIKAVIIDHHEPAGKEETADLYINQKTPATAQELYQLFKGVDFKRPTGFAQTAMLGLYADSGGFAYLNQRHSDTFAMADDLVASGANIEMIKNSLDRYSEFDLKVFSELAANVAHEAKYSYSFINDDFVTEWIAGGKTAAQLHKGTEAFVNDFIRNIDDRTWGFIVYKNVLQGDGMYSVSLRALGGEVDVSLIAGKLGGGGHKGASGAKFEANSVEEALLKVKAVIAGRD